MEIFILFIGQLTLCGCMFFLGYIKGQINLRRNVLNGKDFIEAPILYYVTQKEIYELDIPKQSITPSWHK